MDSGFSLTRCLASWTNLSHNNKTKTGETKNKTTKNKTEQNGGEEEEKRERFCPGFQARR